ncbi:hypothetical protein N9K47_00455 [bacterium]|nr:hypothetical protein [bacterium]
MLILSLELLLANAFARTIKRVWLADAQQASFNEIDEKRTSYWISEQCRIILELELLCDPSPNVALLGTTCCRCTTLAKVMFAPGGWSAPSLMCAIPVFAMWMNALRCTTVLEATLGREYSASALVLATVWWLKVDGASFLNFGTVVSRIRIPEALGTYLHVLSFEDRDSSTMDEQEYRLTSYPFKYNASDGDVLGAPTVAVKVAGARASHSTKADVEKLMAQNVQLMSEMMEQREAQINLQEEIVRLRRE